MPPEFQNKLLVDIGNSRVKWLPVIDGRPQWTRGGNCSHGDLQALPDVGGDTHLAWASVAPAGITAGLVERLGERAGSVRQVRIGQPPGPVAPGYATLGIDRWLALQAVWAAKPQACVIADCGSALTVDLLDEKGGHRGGWIAAGLSAARAGLAQAVPALPEPSDAPIDGARPALDSAAQVGLGLLLQQAATVERAWRACCLELDRPLELWLTGGDGARVQSLLEVPSQYDDQLVLKGLLALDP